MTTLDDVGRANKSDRSSLIHGYLNFYAKLLDSLIKERFTIVEFGEATTSGIETWIQYFPNALVVGVFACAPSSVVTSPRLIIEIGDQADENFLVYVGRKYRPLVVIDDASHRWPVQVMAFKTMFPLLAAGGYYFVEDLQTCFGDDAVKYSNNSSLSIFSYLTQLLPYVVSEGKSDSIANDDFSRYFLASCCEVLFHTKICAIRKKGSVSNDVFDAEHLRIAVPEARKMNNGGPYNRRPVVRLINAPADIASEVTREANGQEVSPPDAYVATLSSAIVHDHGVIETHDKKVIRESFKNMPSLSSFSGFYRVGDSTSYVLAGERQQTSKISGGTYALLRQMNDLNYGHWLVECIPRVPIVTEIYPLSELCFVVSSAPPAMRQVFIDTLSVLGVLENKILFLGATPTMFESLIYPTPITHTPWLLSRRSIRTLEDVGERVISTVKGVLGAKKLYVSRNKYPSRKIVNESEILEIVGRLGYSVIYPETMTFFEQVYCFSKATHVIGNLGAGLTNIVFCPRGCRLLALVTEFMHDDFYVDLQTHKEGTYYSLHGSATEPGRGMWSDFKVDIRQFLDLLQDFE